MRDTRSLNQGWLFLAGEQTDQQDQHGQRNPGESPWCIHGQYHDDTAWRTVDVPHDFVVEQDVVSSTAEAVEAGVRNEDPMDDRLFVSRGSKPYGKAWYRRHFIVDGDQDARRHYLRFDGVYANCTVWVNAVEVHREQSGYSGFWIDVTDFLFYGEDNVIALHVDADFAEGWFYEGGGIYRDVALVSVDATHFAPEGVRVIATPDDETSAGATVHVTAELAGINAPTSLTMDIVAPNGETVATCTESVEAGAAVWEGHRRLDAAQRWTLEQPALYTARLRIARDGKLVDEYDVRFGIRTAVFDKDEGFRLNGEIVKLKGVCCHQDHAGVGVAITEDLFRFRLEKLKEVGANAYRSAHHPASPALLDLCDELGILVMEEHRLFAPGEQQLSQLRRMIRREANHPCIILWSIGNEPAFVQFTERGRRFSKTLTDEVKRLDTTRPVTVALHMADRSVERTAEDGKRRAPNANGLAGTAAAVDVLGMNYNPEHWPVLRSFYPDKPFFCTEASSSLRTRGAWPTDPEACTLYGEDSHEESRIYGPMHWRAAMDPSVAGTFIWTGFDYRGEPTPYRYWPAVSSQFGLYDTCGFLKDNGRYFKSQWRDEPSVSLTPHWNLPVDAGTPVEVHAYTNCPRVTLLLNGEAVATQDVEPGHVVTFKDVPYQPGFIEAKAYQNGHVVATDRVETTGPAVALQVWQMNADCPADEGRTVVLGVKAVDEAGRVVPFACPLVSLAITGARLLGTGNGNPTCHTNDQATERALFNGYLQVLIQPTGDEPASLRVTASNGGLTDGAWLATGHPRA